MAKNNSNNTSNADTQDETPMTTAEAKKRFQLAIELTDEADALEAESKAKLVERSEVLAEIHKALGPGPYKMKSGRYKGQLISIGKRGNKYFFKGVGVQEVTAL